MQSDRRNGESDRPRRFPPLLRRQFGHHKLRSNCDRRAIRSAGDTRVTAMNTILISDPTLRDGNHAVMHQLNTTQITAYCRAADAARIPIVEIGHGNGLAASSLQLGQSLVTDAEMLRIARENLCHS